MKTTYMFVWTIKKEVYSCGLFYHLKTYCEIFHIHIYICTEARPLSLLCNFGTTSLTRLTFKCNFKNIWQDFQLFLPSKTRSIECISFALLKSTHVNVPPSEGTGEVILIFFICRPPTTSLRNTVRGDVSEMWLATSSGLPPWLMMQDMSMLVT